MTQGHSKPEFAKTAIQLLRYREAEVVAVLDSEHAGATAGALFGVGGETPVVGRLEEAGQSDSLFIGIAPAGGRMPEGWSATLGRALRRGMTVVSGLHDRLSQDSTVAAAARAGAGRLIELRTNSQRRVATGQPMRAGCFRVLTVGSDCGVGKMSAAKELELGLRRRGRSARFLATGQTGVMIDGAGVVVDAVIADFINGAVEQLVLENEQHDFLLVEGQGSIAHPAFSAVSLGLLHGAAPDALILCHELGRERLKSAKHVPVRPLAELIRLHEVVGSVRHPCKVVGLALNGRRLGAEAAAAQIERLAEATELPACDVYRDGPDCLVEAVEEHGRRLRVGQSPPSMIEATL